MTVQPIMYLLRRVAKSTIMQKPHALTLGGTFFGKHENVLSRIPLK
jgi:hypothetical protein